MTIIRPEIFAEPQPDQPFIRRDANGTSLFKFAVQYRMGGLLWAADIWAYSHQDAEARVNAMRDSLMVCGQIYCEA
ncbi:hypothetical protein B5K06_30425 [Rhizobium grahamii]|uniref:Uncharacterized protein n=1 Tax=Rhizobium grahamii TaxID=1120045 RepID=A0A370KFX7_9HYPH|nr:hypothetical protein B5K06_30425 [Rhizobium grahamii]